VRRSCAKPGVAAPAAINSRANERISVMQKS
jgi:hypothetical protein